MGNIFSVFVLYHRMVMIVLKSTKSKNQQENNVGYVRFNIL